MTRLRDDGYLGIGAEPRDDSDVVVAACFIGREIMGLSGRPDGQDGYEKEPTKPVAVYQSGTYDGEKFYMWPILIPAKTVAARIDEDSLVWFVIVASVEGDTIVGGDKIVKDWLRKHTGEGEEMNRTKINWSEMTWNPITGCTPISHGCDHCYARAMAKRLQAMGQPKYRNGFNVTVHPELFEEPLRWTKPRMIFVNSMSDTFHESISDEVLMAIFQTMNRATQHTFQVLTKRSLQLYEMAPHLAWTSNIWIGVTIESVDHLRRIEDLRTVPARVRFISFEPLLGPIPANIDLTGIHWVIVGGESGPKARPINYRWVLDIRDACQHQGVAFFFKQWGGRNKKKAGRLLEGRTWDEMPIESRDT